jgi:hypothetical protein
VIMSCFAKIEMSSFRSAKMPGLEGGHRGKRGHDHGESGGVEAVACDSEGIREGDEAGEGGGGT